MDTSSAIKQELPPGTPLSGGAYSVADPIDQGSFGITYAGTDNRLKRPVAIKEFFPVDAQRVGLSVAPPGSMPADTFHSLKATFLMKGEALAKFKHHNIVSVYAVFEENNTAYVVMEFLSGQTLQEVVDEKGQLSEAEAVAMIEQVLSAVSQLHTAGVIHRDIKPKKIMVSQDGRLVLLGFGLTEQLEDSAQGTTLLYGTGKPNDFQRMGTPGYAPPEQYRKYTLSTRTLDVYAVGATLYHLLTGHNPIDAEARENGEVLRAPHELCPEVSLNVSNAVMWAMDMEESRRPQLIDELLLALHTGLPTAAKRQAPDTSPDHARLQALKRINEWQATSELVQEIEKLAAADFKLPHTLIAGARAAQLQVADVDTTALVSLHRTAVDSHSQLIDLLRTRLVQEHTARTDSVAKAKEALAVAKREKDVAQERADEALRKAQETYKQAQTSQVGTGALLLGHVFGTAFVYFALKGLKNARVIIDHGNPLRAD